ELAKTLLDRGANPNAAPVAGRGAGFESKGADISAHIGALKAEQAIKADPSVSGDFYKYAGLFGQNGGDNSAGGNFQGNYNLSSLSPAPKAAIAAENRAPAGDDDAPAPTNGNEVTPFQLALQNADVEMAKLLLAFGAKPLGSTGNGKTALMLAAGLNVDRGVSPGSNQEAFELVKTIYDLGDTNVNAADEMGSAALHAAAQRGSKEIIQFLVDKGARLDVSTAFGWTPLDVARGYRNYLGVGRRVMRNVAPQPEVADLIEKLMKERELETEHFPTRWISRGTNDHVGFIGYGFVMVLCWTAGDSCCDEVAAACIARSVLCDVPQREIEDGGFDARQNGRRSCDKGPGNLGTRRSAIARASDAARWKTQTGQEHI